MSSVDRYVSVVSGVFNVDNTKGGPHQAVISTNNETVNYLLTDTLITAEFIVPGAIWSDDLIVRNIFSHNDSQTNGVNHELNIGDANDTLSIGFSNFTLGIGNADAYALFDESTSTIQIGTNTTRILSTNADTFTTNASTRLDMITPIFEINNANSNAYINLNEVLGSINIG